MASLAGVTDQLQRQNQQELASVIRIANEQLVSSGARPVSYTHLRAHET